MQKALFMLIYWTTNPTPWTQQAILCFSLSQGQLDLIFLHPHYSLFPTPGSNKQTWKYNDIHRMARDIFPHFHKSSDLLYWETWHIYVHQHWTTTVERWLLKQPNIVRSLFSIVSSQARWQCHLYARGLQGVKLKGNENKMNWEKDTKGRGFKRTEDGDWCCV